ncbi:hypothetical protein NGB36_02145 [Streptomyces sp. RB6PN25]|uniref:Uncharacterized protein n=1 Tax=Streptomyces humicola TaxID=2953240 RepID=A0ABT1PP30_9ACTN|nr:hypothetical protein [Streptomyces humicola]MCQ4079431.1 hypothetical protein [Streptomyces humicola]
MPDWGRTGLAVVAAGPARPPVAQGAVCDVGSKEFATIQGEEPALTGGTAHVPYAALKPGHTVTHTCS